MRFLSALPVAASMAFAAPVLGQAFQSTNWCITLNGPGVGDSLLALARQYHPELFNQGSSRDSLFVGLVLDTNCRVVQHAVAHYHASNLGMDNLLAAVFPNFQLRPFLVGGIMHATPELSAGAPWIVWITKRT